MMTRVSQLAATSAVFDITRHVTASFVLVLVFVQQYIFPKSHWDNGYILSAGSGTLV